MPAIAEVLAHSSARLIHSDSPRLDAELLLAQVLQKPRTYLYAWPEKALTAEQGEQFEALVCQRERGLPIAHILGWREFWSLQLAVNEHTLIPRPDTEILVEAVLERMSAANAQVLDLGTGSGAIALALASERPAWKILACDLSGAALAVAAANCRRLALPGVHCVNSSWADAVADGCIDLVVSNPPYIDAADPHLLEGDVRFEPRTALVADDHGMAAIDSVITAATRVLKPGGLLAFEHGYDQGDAARRRLQEAGLLAVETVRDYGGNERASLGVKRG